MASRLDSSVFINADPFHLAVRLRRPVLAPGAVPPSAARRSAASRWIRTSSPRSIKRVFSWLPVQSWDFATNSSFRLRVVLMPIDMLEGYVSSIQRKTFGVQRSTFNVWRAQEFPLEGTNQ
jgi:hypothetical protein